MYAFRYQLKIIYQMYLSYDIVYFVLRFIDKKYFYYVWYKTM